MKEITEKRRQQVYDLCVRKSQPVQEVAKLMNVPTSTIQSDLRHVNKQVASEIMELGHEQLLINIIEDHRSQRARIFKYLQNDLHDTARAKYESILLDVSKSLERYYEKLAKITQKISNKTLEDSLAEMTFTRFNEVIGLPLHPYKRLPCAITQAQMKLFNAVHPTKRSWVVLNKSRQCGYTELSLRCMAYYAFSKYRGKKIALVAGTRIETTLQIYERLCNLFKNINDVVSSVSPQELRLKNGTSFHVVPASKNAINGWTAFSAFLLDESAFWNLEEDQVILNSFLPIARTNSSDIYMISNPAGPRGFFYRIIDAPSPSWTKLEINIHEGGKELYTEQQIQEMIDSSDEDPSSSYLCKFIGGRDSIFGDLSPEDQTSIYEAVAFD